MKHQRSLRQTCVCSLVCLVVAVARAQTTLRADDNAPPTGDGLTWSTAYKYYP